MGSVGQATRMQGKGTAINTPSAHKIAFGIVQHFIRVNIGMVIGSWNGQRVIVEQTRHKGANDKIMRLKRLVDWGWLVNAPRNRLKIVNG